MAEKYIPSVYAQAEEDVKLEQYCNAVSYRLNNLENPTDVDCKRWPWELIQNAKDTIVNSKTIQSVDVEFEHYVEDGNEIVKFSHNGEPFTGKAISGLIWKFSAEKRDEFYTEDGVSRDKQSTGRFGTGFLTTHTLSKRVKISGVLFDPSKGRNISVNFTLYREGNDEDLKKGITRTLDEMEFDTRPLSGNEKTEFYYILRNEINKKAARLGFEEIKANGVMTMLFCPTVRSIRLNDRGQITKIKRLSDTPVSGCQDMSRVIFEVTYSSTDTPQHRHFLIVSKETHSDILSEYWNKERNLRLQVAVELTEDNRLVNQNYRTTPSVFCSLPLTGFENFTLPYYVNSNDFEPTGERTSIYLRKDKDGEEYDEKKGKNRHKYYNNGINWHILEVSRKLFETIVDYAIENKIKNMYSFANGLNIDLNNATWGDCVNMDALASRLIIPLRNLVLNKKLVEVVEGEIYSQAKLLRFPIQKKDKEDFNKNFYGLCSEYYGESVPSKEISNEWEKRAWKKYSKWSEDFKEKVENDPFPVIQLVDLIKDVEVNGNVLSMPSNIDSKFGWLNKLYAILSTDKAKMEEHSIIPNWNGVFKKLDNEKLLDGRELPSSIFDFMKSYGIDWSDSLVNKEVEGVIFSNVLTSEKVSDEINKRSAAIIEEVMKQNYIDENSKQEQIFSKLFLLFKRTPNTEISEINKTKYKTLLGFIETAFRKECNKLSTYGNQTLDVHFKAWEKTNEWFAQLLVSKIAEKGQLDNAVDKEEDEQEYHYCTVEWLSDVVNFMLDNKYISISDLSKEGKFLIPNRKGIFCAYTDLRGIGVIPEELLSVDIERIGVDLKGRLIHQNFLFTDGNNYPTKEELSSVVSSINKSFNNDETYNSPQLIKAAQYILYLNNPVMSDTNIAQLRELYGEIECMSYIITYISTTDASLWSGATLYISNYLIAQIESFENVREMAIKFRESKDDCDSENKEDVVVSKEDKDFVFKWLNRFYSYLDTKKISYENKKIVPNYHEKFVTYRSETLYDSTCIKKHEQNNILIDILENDLAKCTLWSDWKDYDHSLIDNIIHPEICGLKAQKGLFAKLSGHVDYMIDKNYKDKTHCDLLKPLAEKLFSYFDENNGNVENGNYFPITYNERNNIAMDLIYTPDERKRLQRLYSTFSQDELEEIINNKGIVAEIIQKNISIEEIEKICGIRGFDSLKLIISEFPNYDFSKLLEILKDASGDFELNPTIMDELKKERNLAIGDEGEAFVYQQILGKYTKEEIIWSNLCKDDEKGDRTVEMNGKHYHLKTTSHDYDFRINLPDQTIYIEVKSTIGKLEQSKAYPLIFETKEWKHVDLDSLESNDIHIIARVFDVEGTPSVYYLKQTTLIS